MRTTRTMLDLLFTTRRAGPRRSASEILPSVMAFTAQCALTLLGISLLSCTDLTHDVFAPQALCAAALLRAIPLCTALSEAQRLTSVRCTSLQFSALGERAA